MSSQQELQQLLRSLRTAAAAQPREEEEEDREENSEDEEGLPISRLSLAAAADPRGEDDDEEEAKEREAASGSEESAESESEEASGSGSDSNSNSEGGEDEVVEDAPSMLDRLRRAATYQRSVVAAAPSAASSSSSLNQAVVALLRDPANISSSNDVSQDFAHLMKRGRSKGMPASLIHSESDLRPYCVAGYFDAKCGYCRDFHPTYQHVSEQMESKLAALEAHAQQQGHTVIPKHFGILHINGKYGGPVPRVVFYFDGQPLPLHVVTKEGERISVETRDPVELSFMIEVLYHVIYPRYADFPRALQGPRPHTLNDFRSGILSSRDMALKCQTLMAQEKHQGFLKRWLKWFKLKLSGLLYGKAQKKCASGPPKKKCVSRRK